MKTSEEILLQEIKDEYYRQLSNWREFNHKSQNFLQINGLVLSVVFIGISISENISTDVFILLSISSFFIILSTITALITNLRKTIKEIDIKIKNNADLKNNEEKLIRGLIRIYNLANNNVIQENNKRSKEINFSVVFLILGMIFLFSFIVSFSINVLFTKFF